MFDHLKHFWLQMVPKNLPTLINFFLFGCVFIFIFYMP